MCHLTGNIQNYGQANSGLFYLLGNRIFEIMILYQMLKGYLIRKFLKSRLLVQIVIFY